MGGYHILEELGDVSETASTKHQESTGVNKYIFKPPGREREETQRQTRKGWAGRAGLSLGGLTPEKSYRISHAGFYIS